jgi:hypothetical protein
MTATETLPVESLSAYAVALRAAGYDVTLADVATGRRERGGRVREIVIDAGGRLRLTETCLLEAGQTQRIQHQGARFRLLRQQHEVITVMVELSGPAALPGILDALDGLLAEPMSEDSQTRTRR